MHSFSIDFRISFQEEEEEHSIKFKMPILNLIHPYPNYIGNLPWLKNTDLNNLQTSKLSFSLILGQREVESYNRYNANCINIRPRLRPTGYTYNFQLLEVSGSYDIQVYYIQFLGYQIITLPKKCKIANPPTPIN